jgi:hypothetical protein
MRRGILLLPLALLLLLPATLLAQTRERVKVTGVRLGLPLGPFNNDSSRRGIFKAGQWAPVYVDLECTKDTDEALLVVVETEDADDAATEGVIEIAAMSKGDRLTGSELGRLAYLKPGKTYAQVKVRIKGAESGRTFGESATQSGMTTSTSIEGPAFVILGIGHNLNGFRLPGGNERGGEDAMVAQRGEIRGGWVETAQLIEVGQLPDQWIGYGAVDVMVIGTGADQDFWVKLSAPQHEKRRKALVEWVRRGGRVIISAGANVDVLEALKEIKDMLPATIPPGGKRTVTGLQFAWRSSGVSGQQNADFAFPDRKEFAVAELQPRADRPTRTLVETYDNAKKPLIVQGPYGQGRVTVVAWDLDRSPFVDWNKRSTFWENLVAQAGYSIPSGNQKFDKYGGRMDEYAAALQGNLDYFEGVPVVSFGWVALFILIYIVLIGPVDYLFLKKVVKRLEWTWVTFPVIVITVSAGAYFAAYALKGKDLKINKVDVVDIDLVNKRIDGNTWFTLFSPRIHNYTIGVEPAGGVSRGDPSLPRWTPAEASDSAHNSILSWQNTIDRNRYGSSGGGGFFTKKYKYQSMVDPQDPNRDLYASGLEGVPIQVWTTKAFAGQWTAPIDPENPLIIADLSETAEKVLVGTITSHLPVQNFSDVALIWRGKVFNITDLAIGVPKSVGRSIDEGQDLKAWVTDEPRRYAGADINKKWYPQQQQPAYYGSSTYDRGTTNNPIFRLWPLLFYEGVGPVVGVGQVPNASLRNLDQSWRVAADRPEQAILVLRIPTRETPAEEMTRSADSPSRLWIGELPTSGKPRPAVQGTLKQETYIRVFIPVKPAKK